MNESDFKKKTLDKWKKAVIHLLCWSDNTSAAEFSNKNLALLKQKINGLISEDQYMQEFAKLQNGRSGTTGTAIFFEHNNRKFLLTARHVVHDEDYAEREYKARIEEINAIRKENPNYMGVSPEWLKLARDNSIYSEIFSVPSIDEVINPKVKRINALYLRGNIDNRRTFSSPELDLAIISLQDSTPSQFSFAEQLVQRGYSPVTLSDISTSGPTGEGEEVFTVGYPAATAYQGDRNISEVLTHFESHFFSTPVFSFGRVAMLNEHLDSFLADISIYPGNSGGPVIENGKLVGIVKAQPVLDLEPGGAKGSFRIPFGYMVNSKHLVDLINMQLAKGD